MNSKINMKKGEIKKIKDDDNSDNEDVEEFFCFLFFVIMRKIIMVLVKIKCYREKGKLKL